MIEFQNEIAMVHSLACSLDLSPTPLLDERRSSGSTTTPSWGIWALRPGLTWTTLWSCAIRFVL